MTKGGDIPGMGCGVRSARWWLGVMLIGCGLRNARLWFGVMLIALTMLIVPPCQGEPAPCAFTTPDPLEPPHNAFYNLLHGVNVHDQEDRRAHELVGTLQDGINCLTGKVIALQKATKLRISDADEHRKREEQTLAEVSKVLTSLSDQVAQLSADTQKNLHPTVQAPQIDAVAVQ